MKVLWIDCEEGKPMPYVKEEHSKLAQKFLFWEKVELLLVGPQHNHELLMTIAHIIGFPKPKAWDSDDAPELPPDGAGNIVNGVIDSWGSGHYNVFTTEEKRSLIKKLLLNPKLEKFWIDVNKGRSSPFIKEWHPDESAVFLFWADELLLVGNAENHNDLTLIAELSCGISLPEREPDVACFMENGRISSWSVGTNSEYMDLLVEMLTVSC